MAMATHVRQVKRATGYRIDVIAGAFQYIVADIEDNGQFKVTRSTYAKLLNFDTEQISSKVCIERFGMLTFDAPLSTKPSQGQAGYGQSGYNAPLLRRAE
ncbi:hypothetical protein A9977_14545 [Variovorax sp. UMC13]|nr:hypothetical protein [Variovorax sp. UMC13]